ncbi:efflux RND transporter periplasmic adaptor subunit [Mesorhizobium sp. ANAO-SY3R2]|uniref:efflux RND transporter periplasmic adaptor subunit n=1 Tax=Mesorhizobium sp. ANAO-SY3R2 TaxID=3166644 RepID=UPI00366BBFF5
MRTFRPAILVPVALVAGAVLFLAPGLGDRVRREVTEAMANVGATPGTSRRSGAGQRPAAVPIAVSVATVQSGSFPVITRIFGNVLSPAVVQVGARISSQVTSVHVNDGQMVQAGDLLISLDDRALRAQLARDQAILAKDSALVVSTTADLNRARDLVTKQAGTRQAYDAALAAMQGAEATVEGDKATIEADEVQLGFTQIAAPISGRLGAVQVAVGDLVGGSAFVAGSANSLVSITQVDPIDVVFRLPEADLPIFKRLLDTGKPPTVRALNSSTAEVLATGVLSFIDSTVDTTSGTIAMRATFANSALVLWPGQYVDVEIEQSPLNGAAIIPTVALQPGQAGQFVYLVRADNTIEARPVKVAMTEGANAAIAEGLEPGDRVVTEGQLQLKPGIAVRPTLAGSDAQAASASQPPSLNMPGSSVEKTGP